MLIDSLAIKKDLAGITLFDLTNGARSLTARRAQNLQTAMQRNSQGLQNQAVGGIRQKTSLEAGGMEPIRFWQKNQALAARSPGK